MSIIKLSTFSKKRIFFEKSFKDEEQFFINILDKNGKPKLQWVGTVENLKYALRIT
ncbi:TPA: hypothetical protein ACT5CK_002339 [Flavobacterium psychrophilum]|uniref:hypothetical protein n=1 Tax=Flavobacterium psychrophilum TaxID=96345 RepID=UPI00076EDE98|nr:hypothetical protein [Flavobacterium psychrophilum]SNB96790.1 hypothetical protein FPC840_2680007 [Flavobacterium psychrophilum]GAQ50130.1 N-acetyl-gamma-glutamyl-phosphate reductase [Flavobacterium psychrophilum]GAW90767.1 hypothetical protein FPS14_contig00105-0002 [Flavobacterium psychrophilum]GEJ30977.1 hypothetical protein FPN186_contig00129-0004 [Flavobacterium psychrophilum]GEJ33825.1 hypothetical protein FPN185_contig00086-0001 [Flavobacterium psychrophilum]